jgi:hypothetical protein
MRTASPRQPRKLWTDLPTASLVRRKATIDAVDKFKPPQTQKS